MDALMVGAALVGSCATALVVERALLGAVLRALARGKPVRLNRFPTNPRSSN
jgi:hypothetical protein